MVIPARASWPVELASSEQASSFMSVGPTARATLNRANPTQHLWSPGMAKYLGWGRQGGRRATEDTEEDAFISERLAKTSDKVGGETEEGVSRTQSYAYPAKPIALRSRDPLSWLSATESVISHQEGETGSRFVFLQQPPKGSR
ncbi:unnamed protein product [Boreogadus saida]